MRLGLHRRLYFLGLYIQIQNTVTYIEQGFVHINLIYIPPMVLIVLVLAEFLWVT